MTIRTLAVALLAGSVLAMSLPSAEAGHRRHHNHHKHYKYKYKDNGAAGAIIGLGFGVIIGSMLAQPRYDDGYYGYDDSARYGYRPKPWTPEWYSYCDDKYKTFNPRTGKFRGYDGNLHFCR